MKGIYVYTSMNAVRVCAYACMHIPYDRYIYMSEVCVCRLNYDVTMKRASLAYPSRKRATQTFMSFVISRYQLQSTSYHMRKCLVSNIT